jgi:hypothetical protein
MTRTARKKAVMAAGVLAAAYVAYPYVTLYRLGDAIRRGDATPLESLVDWDGVREGIKEDVCDNVLAVPPPPQVVQDHQAGAALPPFGASFVRGIAGNVIDKNVTPTGLVSAAQRSQAVDASGEPARQAAEPRADPRIVWAFFDGPTSFSVDLLPPGDAAVQEPIRIQMQLRHGEWKVTRAWLPPSMLVQANART